MSVRILQGDCRDLLRSLEADSIDCVVTSPPYWGLRDYGVNGQLGLETSLGEHISVMAAVFSEVRRVLKPTGTLWLNYGDCYAASVNGRSAADTKAAGNDDWTFRDKPFSTVGPIYVADGGQVPDSKNRKARIGATDNKGNKACDHGGRVVAGRYLKPKDLCGVPWRVAFALQESGWWLRQDIIWSKPNPMPESVRDRCTKAHEYLFLLSKSKRYYFDQSAIAEETIYAPSDGEPNSFRTSVFNAGKTGVHQLGRSSDRPRRASKAKDEFSPDRKRNGDNGTAPSFRAVRETRNKRSVWEIATAPYSEAHFATFPPALIEPCILAGCPEGGMVLDPFGGAGTTGLVADRLGRNAILIELNPEYAAMAERRIHSDAGLFASIKINKFNRPESSDDFAKSLNVAYDTIRDRVASGGQRGWMEEK